MGNLRISPLEWPHWTLREFYSAYKAWRKVNIIDPWERARVQVFTLGTANGAKWKEPKDAFSIPGEKRKKRHVAIIREPTKAEKELLESLKDKTKWQITPF